MKFSSFWRPRNEKDDDSMSCQIIIYNCSANIMGNKSRNIFSFILQLKIWRWKLLIEFCLKKLRILSAFKFFFRQIDKIFWCYRAICRRFCPCKSKRFLDWIKGQQMRYLQLLVSWGRGFDSHPTTNGQYYT